LVVGKIKENSRKWQMLLLRNTAAVTPETKRSQGPLLPQPNNKKK